MELTHEIIIILVWIIGGIALFSLLWFFLGKHINKPGMGKIDKEKYKNSKIVNEKWLEHYFRIDLEKPKGVSHEDFMLYIEESFDRLWELLLGALFKCPPEVKKNMTLQGFGVDGEYFILLRFVDRKKGDAKITKINIREKGPTDKRKYEFTPIESIMSVELMKQTELHIIAFTDLEQTEDIMWYFGYDDKKRPTVTESDGIQYFSYPIEKRIELYKKHPELEAELFPNFPFDEFIYWLLEKKNDNVYMKKYCVKVEKILRKKELGILKEEPKKKTKANTKKKRKRK